MKNVVLIFSTFALVALFGACGGNDNKETKESKARRIAKEMCECKGDYDCTYKVQKEWDKITKDLDYKELDKLMEIFLEEYNKCSNDDKKRDYDDDDDYYGNNPYTEGARIGEQICNCNQMSGYEQYECMKRAEEEYYRLRGKYSGSQLDDFESALGLAVQNCSMNSVEDAVQEEAIEDYDYDY